VRQCGAIGKPYTWAADGVAWSLATDSAGMTLTLSGLFDFAPHCRPCAAAIGRGNRRWERAEDFSFPSRVGFVGALFGTFIAGYMHLPELLMVAVDGHRFSDSCGRSLGRRLFVALVHLVFLGRTAAGRVYDLRRTPAKVPTLAAFFRPFPHAFGTP